MVLTVAQEGVKVTECSCMHICVCACVCVCVCVCTLGRLFSGRVLIQGGLHPRSVSEKAEECQNLSSSDTLQGTSIVALFHGQAFLQGF